jgi:hypothetical protein
MYSTLQGKFVSSMRKQLLSSNKYNTSGLPMVACSRLGSILGLEDAMEKGFLSTFEESIGVLPKCLFSIPIRLIPKLIPVLRKPR